MVASVMVIATPAQAALQDTSATCPDSIPSAGFTDLGGLDAATVAAIDCLVFHGISQGTSATTYSPNDSVARWQMALFLTRTASVMGVALPDGSPQGFTDIGALDAATQKAINQLKQLGITAGTSATTFSPSDDVSRWQMALFLTRLLSTAGNALPDGSSQGFTDIGGLDAATQKAINQTVQLGVSNGTSATTFSPTPDTLRWHMSLFLTRAAAADGVQASGLGFIVTALASPDVSYADTTLGKVVKAITKATDKFSVDGAAATQGAFFAAATHGDLLNIVPGTVPTYQLTNKSAASYTSGVIDVVTATSFDIIEPISGVHLNTIATDGIYQLFTTDGAPVSVAAFNLDAQAGDTVVITGTGSVTSIQTVALTNQTVSGTVKGAAAPTFGLTPFSDTFTAVAGDSITIDGTADTLVNFNLELSNGDAISYAKKGGKATIAMTNKALAAISGKVLNNDEINVLLNLGVVDVDTTGGANQAYANAGTVYIVNGILSSETGLEAALTAGDDISIVRADGDVNLVDQVTLTDGAFSGTPTTRVDLVNTITVLFKTGGVESEAIDYTILGPDVGLLGTGTVKYVINGSSALVGPFEVALDSIIGGAFTGTVSVAKVGNDIVWTVTTS